MPSLVEDVKHIPPWLLVAGVGGLGAVFLLVHRSSGGRPASAVSAGDTNTGLGSITATPVSGPGHDASTLQSISTLPASPANPNSITTLGDMIAKAFPASYGQPGAQDSIGGSYSAGQNAALQGAMNADTIDYQKTIAEAAPHDPAVQQLEQEWATFNPGGSNFGNWQAWQGLQGQAQTVAAQYGQQQVTPLQKAGGGSGQSITDVLPFGYATEMTSGILADWTKWMGRSAPRAGLNDKQRYVARATHHELSARHKDATDAAVAQLLGGV